MYQWEKLCQKNSRIQKNPYFISRETLVIVTSILSRKLNPPLLYIIKLIIHNNS